MLNLCLSIILTIFSFLAISMPVKADSDSSFVSIVNPIRGLDFWDKKDQTPEETVLGQLEINTEIKIPSTFLLRFDALSNTKIVDNLKNSSAEKGLFLEITPTWTTNANVTYHPSALWHNAGSIFLTGYSPNDREKLIDSAFNKFKQKFGSYPQSVGAWWIDSYSLEYMYRKYNILAALIVSDQYSTDNYQIWGQFWSTPYYPFLKNTIYPAQNKENKIPVVITQWASRDPYNGYGKGVEESTFSVQANDYIDYHNLGSDYFSSLVDIYTTQKFNKLGFLTVGLENSYSWKKYQTEYKKQIEILQDKQAKKQLKIVTMSDFAKWYKDKFHDLSPSQLLDVTNPLDPSSNREKSRVVWFMNQYYRVGLFINERGVSFRDIRQYLELEEPCLQKVCDNLNFATFPTRVLDDVTYQQSWNIDEGNIHDFSITKDEDKVVINYKNEAGKMRDIEFLLRDIKVNNKVYSIDTAILNAISQSRPNNINKPSLNFQTDNILVLKNLLLYFPLFLILVLVGFILPGWGILNLINFETSLLERIFTSLVLGLISFSLITYLSLFLKIKLIVPMYLIIFGIFFLKKIKKEILSEFLCRGYKWVKRNLSYVFLIVFGTAFQSIPTIRSGVEYSYGYGFWGPNAHDGLWHIALARQLLKSIPPINPDFSGTMLFNYHFYFDLTLAGSHLISRIPFTDLIFRFYPVLFSLFLGIGTLVLFNKLFHNESGGKKIPMLISLSLVYFAGSFGWIVEYIKNKSLGGESDFWVNQSISFNLNPPFAASILICILSILLMSNLENTRNKKLILLTGIVLGVSLGFKAYGAILLILSLGILSLANLFKKRFILFATFIISVLTAFLVYIPVFKAQDFLVFKPFWFIHSMIDFQDRVGWTKLSSARNAYFERGEMTRFLLIEILALAVFIVGNLGFRSLGLFMLFKNNAHKSINFVKLMGILSISIPIFLIQKGNPWNTIQFFYYGLFIFSILSGVVYFKVVKFFPKRINTCFLILLFVLSSVNSFSTAYSYFINNPHTFISRSELEALKKLEKLPDGAILSYPYDKNLKTQLNEPFPIYAYETTSYIAALTGKQVYLADEIQQDILQTDFVKRRVSSKDLFSIGNRDFLTENNIKYIYIPKVFADKIDEEKLKLKKIIENKEVNLYEVI